MGDPVDAAARFEAHRKYLVGLAYRMLGSVSDAEDIVQDAYLRWQKAGAGVENSRAFLSKVVTRLCLDHLKSARMRRETYVGPWLPEPVFDEAALAAESASDLSHDISVALMLTLERLSPLERAAFLLHDVFDIGFAEIADALGRSEAACRQLAARARAHVRAARPRFNRSAEDQSRLAAAFLQAASSGDASALTELLAEDAIFYADGGGKRPASLNPIRGRDNIVRFFVKAAEKGTLPAVAALRPASINGLAGFVVREASGMVETVAIESRDGHISAIYVVGNPDKLKHLPSVSGGA